MEGKIDSIPFFLLLLLSLSVLLKEGRQGGGFAFSSFMYSTRIKERRKGGWSGRNGMGKLRNIVTGRVEVGRCVDIFVYLKMGLEVEFE